MTRTRKWLLRIGIAVGALVAVIVIAATWLLYTTPGLHFALDRGVAITHGQFTYANASGTLAGEAKLAGLHYRNDDGTTLRIEHATLDLQPWALLARSLHIRKARIDGIALDIMPSKSPEASGNASLQPPLTFMLDDIQLTHIAVSESGKPVFAADSLALAGTWSKHQLALRELALRAASGSVDLDGSFATTPGYHGQADAHVDWTQAGTRYVGTLKLGSDGKTARIDAALSAPLRADASATLALDPQHAWTLAVQAPKFNASALPGLPAALKTLALDLHGAGDARGGKLDGTLAANDHVVALDPAQFSWDGKTLKLDPLRLRSPSMAGVATATGSVHLDASPITAALAIDWHDVQLPADLVGQTLATHGSVQVDGSTERYALKGALAIGPPGKLSDLQLDLSGTPQVVTLNTLKLVQSNGGLDMHGDVGLQPVVTWKLDATAKHLDPGTLFAGWNGAMDFALATQGKLTPRGPQATLKLTGAAGTLRGQSIAGSKADITIAPGNLLAGSLTLVAGGSRIQATGQPGAQTNATLALDVASLGDWIPHTAGKLQGQFTVKGAWPKLAVAGHLSGSGLDVSGRRVDTLQLTASVPDISQPGGKLDLTLAGVHASGFDFDSVTLTGSGTANSHQLKLAATGAQLGAKLTLRGSWRAQSRAWTGTLSDVELEPQGMPAWHQQQPSALTWRNGAATLAQLCLGAATSRLCLAGKRDANGSISANYDLQDLPLQLLATLASGADPWLASGDISGTGQLTLAANGTLGGTASLNASAGQIAFASTANQPLLAWTSIKVEANATGGNQHVSLRGALAAGGHINGDLDVRGSTGALSGTLAAELHSLAFISALSPEVANVQGSLAGQLTFGGTLAAPQFNGRLQTQGFSAELPRAGLKLHDGAIAITGDPQGHLAITGSIASGKGVLHVDGSTGLAADAPLLLNLKGDNVLVADIPAAHVVASPNLQLTRSKGTFTLTGSIDIPSAKVEVDKLPGQGPAEASPDVVIVDAPPAAKVSPLALDAAIEVKLGNDVKLHGYGLDGTVGGQLTVLAKTGATATGRGQISVAGKYQAYGQDLDIERGRLLFAGTRLDNPGLDIRAVRKIRSAGVTVGLSVRGTAQRPVLTVISVPSMEQAEALSYLVTGRPLNALKSGEGDTLNTAAQALGGLAGDRLAKSIGSRIGLEAGVSSSEALGGSAFTAGKYLSPRLFLSYGVGLFSPGQVITLRYTLNRFLQFEAENASTGSRASLNYQIEK
ncbi:MAG TPA: translocation/assembly module TamB domain-containing protein [Rhodanobacteraceae bacterium]|nr:translocation/assembly module TamB domain-containing protein [Rhodanobacteraceae bacterium]